MPHRACTEENVQHIQYFENSEGEVAVLYFNRPLK